MTRSLLCITWQPDYRVYYTILTVSATLRADILYLLAKQNLQNTTSSSSSNTFSESLGPETSRIHDAMSSSLNLVTHQASWECQHQVLCYILDTSNILYDRTSHLHPDPQRMSKQVDSLIFRDKCVVKYPHVTCWTSSLFFGPLGFLKFLLWLFFFPSLVF